MRTFTTLVRATPLFAALTLSTIGASTGSRPLTLQEKYALKVDTNPFVPAEFTVKLNGEVVGTYDDKSDVDLTSSFKAGKNTVTVNWRNTGAIKNRFAKTKLTLGVQRNGKWSTVLTATATEATPKGTKTITINAK